jgi:DNA polymerase III delta subunit
MSLWILSGEDAFLRDNQRKQLLAQWLADVPDALHALLLTRLTNPPLTVLTDTLMTQVFALGGTPILDIQGFDPFKQAIASDTQREALENALLSTTKHVVFSVPKLDKKLKWVKWLLAQPNTQHEVFDPLAFWETDKAVARLMQLAKQQHITLQPAAADHMVDALGMDFYSLLHVLEQAFVLAKGQPVTQTHVTPFLPSGDNLFDALSDWIQQTSVKRWHVLDHVLETDAPQRVLALIQKMLHDYWLVKTLTEQGQTPQDIAGWVGKKPGWVSMQLKWLQKVPTQRLAHLKAQTLDTENALKSGQLDARLALEMLWAS